MDDIKREAVKEFAEKLKQAICDNTYPYFDKNGKPVNIWNTDGFDRIDELLKEYEKMKFYKIDESLYKPVQIIIQKRGYGQEQAEKVYKKNKEKEK